MAEKRERSDKGNQRGGNRQDNRQKAVGMGDHVPAFMMRTFEIKRASRNKTETEKEVEIEDVVEAPVSENDDAEAQ